jgi:two-component system OmpR family response regulator/two-component system response regulator ChvI
MVGSARDGVEGLRLAANADLVLCDVNMPRLDGFTLCKRLREARSRVPVILLTSRGSDIDEALGLLSLPEPLLPSRRLRAAVPSSASAVRGQQELFGVDVAGGASSTRGGAAGREA